MSKLLLPIFLSYFAKEKLIPSPSLLHKEGWLLKFHPMNPQIIFQSDIELKKKEKKNQRV